MRTRTLITLLTVGAATLTGCSATQTGNPDGTDISSVAQATTDPLEVCGPVKNVRDALSCVPGVGTAAHLNTPPTAPPGVTEFKTITATTPYQSDGRWVMTTLSTFIYPSSGLTVARLGAQLQVFDIADDTIIRTVDLGEARVSGLISVDGTDTVVAVLTDKNLLRRPVGSPNAPVPATEVTMLGVRTSDGTILWKRNDTITSTSGPAESSVIPAYSVPATRKTCITTSNPASEAFGIDTANGSSTWSVNLSTLPGPRDNKQDCTADEVTAGIVSPVVQIVRQAAPGFYGDANYNLRTNLVAATGRPLPRFTKSAITEAVHDPLGPLALITADDGTEHGSRATYVIDAATGDVKATVDTKAISAVGGTVQGLSGGLIYVKKGTEIFTLDAITGKETGPSQSIPFREVNGWILHLDGTMTPKN